MGLHWLKPLRIGVSILFFALITFLFLDLSNAGVQRIAQKILYFQFVPSLLKFLTAATLGATGFITVLILTLLFGRVYCSTLCPLGTLQDVFSFLSGKKQKHRGFQYTASHNVLHYFIFVLLSLFLFAGSGFLLNLLDPFSIFGRISSNIFRPVVITLNNAVAMGMETMGIHLLSREKWTVFAPLSIGVSIGMLLLIVMLSTKHGRLYCNSICPVGALMGLVSKFSLFRIEMDTDTCTGCRLCEGVCKAGCINIQQKTIEFSRCVSCYNCFAACRKNGLQFRNQWRPQRHGKPSAPSGRRDFLATLVMGLAGTAVDAFGQTGIIQSRPTRIPEQITTPVTPPGSVSVAHFCSTCTACHLCVSACPSQVLVPSFLQYGSFGIMQPRMDYHAGHCNYDCTICLNVCPSGAILPLSREKKKRTQLGMAKFIKENCVVYTDNTNCGACSEHCPTKAVDMVPYLNTSGKQLVIPKINPDICVGCGGCEYACPTQPYKAIYVDGNRIHQLAQKPVEKELDRNIDPKKAFPF